MNITGSENGTFVTLNGAADALEYAQALDLVQYENILAGPDVTQRRVAFVVNDDNNLVSTLAETTVDILVFDDPPVLDLDGSDCDGVNNCDYAGSYVTGQNATPVAIADVDASITDDGAAITAATVTISNAEPGDVLTVGALPAGITADTSVTGALTLSGSASAANYITALRALRFSNTGTVTATGVRSITVTVTDDGTNTSNTATASITVAAAPVVDLNGVEEGAGFTTRFTPGSVESVPLADLDATIIDEDSTNLTQLSISIANPAPGDELTVDTAQLNILGIAVDAASTTTSKLLTGDVDKAGYIAALGHIGYLNSTVVPHPVARQVEFVATDDDSHQGLATVTTVGIGSDFAISFDAMPGIVADSSLVYTINVTNVGNTAATDLVLTSVVDEDAFIMDMQDPNGAGWDCSDFQSGLNPTAVCSLPSLDPGEEVMVAIEIMTPAFTKEIVNNVTVSNSDPQLGTGTASQSSLVVNFLDGNGFLPEDKLTDIDGATIHADQNAGFGKTLLLHDDLLIVGSPHDRDLSGDLPDTGMESGAVVVYRRGDTGWSLLKRLEKPEQPNARADGDLFGKAIAYNGNWLVVGAPGAGEAYVYDANFANPQSLLINDGSGSAGNNFGIAVDVSNGRIAVGATHADV